MGRKPTTFKLGRIADVSSTPAVRAYLRRLLATGFYGTSEGQVLERLVCRQLETLIAEGKLQREPDLPIGPQTDEASPA